MALTIAEREHLAFAKILSEHGFSDTDDVSLSAVLNSALQTLEAEVTRLRAQLHDRELVESMRLFPVIEELQTLRAQLAACERLPRYGPWFNADDPQVFDGMNKESLGDWVKYSDLIALLHPAPPSQKEQ